MTTDVKNERSNASPFLSPARPPPMPQPPWHQRLALRSADLWLAATLDGRHFRALLRYRLCMQLSPLVSTCSSCGTSMDINGDHALLCRGDPSFVSFQLRQRMMQPSLSTILRQGNVTPLSRLTSDYNAMIPCGPVVALV